MQVIENWRASHAHVINTFQMTLRNRAKDKAKVGQRLKRRVTILDKVVREPNMALAAMNDVAGCRLIFETVDELYSFRDSLRLARMNSRRSVEKSKDYILHPKISGYRGVHEIYEYMGKPGFSTAYNGLHVEIQYRTSAQHAWATAVETAGMTSLNQPKFGRGDQDYLEFFRIASEIIARTTEHRTSCLPETSDSDLKNLLYKYEERTHLLSSLERLQTAAPVLDFKQNTILMFSLEPETLGQLQTRSYESLTSAMRELSELETKFEGKSDIVLVKSVDIPSLTYVYQNYFSNTSGFVDMVRDGVDSL
ncbi:RelA/SpoT domain-containing protein [Sphingomonas sp. Leaf412]|uniref:RelA/SpoT domain-containing protein n=1 Tax=Sphingomonas sp. Leaf412 TaxID=1736370 RepID=UPI001F375DAE|nr:RelA/SpoT domain-containing protein [Sphingomonas sp. Leaf412]